MHCHFVLVARETIEFINQHIVPSVFIAVFKHALECGSIIVCSGHSAINIGVDDNDVVAFGIITTDM